MIGGGKLYGMGILTTALLTLVTPLVARLGYIPLVSLRIIEGFLEVNHLTTLNPITS